MTLQDILFALGENSNWYFEVALWSDDARELDFWLAESAIELVSVWKPS